MKMRWFSLLEWIVLAHSLAIILFWLTNRLFYASVNDFLADTFGAKLNYISICLGLSFSVLLWCAARLLLSWQDRPQGGWVFLVAGPLYLLFFYGSFIMLFQQDSNQVARLGQFIFYFRIFFDSAILLGLAVLLRGWFFRGQTVGSRPVVLAAGLLLFALVWLVPAIWPPVAVYRGVVPPRPRIIAHRGAAMLAPENTLASARLATELGAYGLEGDIHISRDGVPFLMHDNDLARTTNVAEVFPLRQADRAESFTLAELKQLNAGEWFVQADPFRTIAAGLVTPAQLVHYRQEPVATLTEILQFLKQNEMIFIFDLNQPPAGHPFHDTYFDIVLDMLRQAGIDGRIWYLVNDQELAKVKAAAPQMTPVYGGEWRQMPPLTDLAARGYRVINSDFSFPPEWLALAHQAGLVVNQWTVDEPWQFTRQWLLSVDSMTTDNLQGMLALQRPSLAMPYNIYLPVWGVIGLVGLAILLIKRI